MEAYFVDKTTGNAHKRMKTSFLYNPWEQRAKRRDKDQKARNSCTVHLVKHGCIDECCVYEQQVNNIHQQFTKHPPPPSNRTTQRSAIRGIVYIKALRDVAATSPQLSSTPFQTTTRSNGVQDVTKFSKNRKAQSLNNKRQHPSDILSTARFFFSLFGFHLRRVHVHVRAWVSGVFMSERCRVTAEQCSWERGPRHATKWGGAQCLDYTTQCLEIFKCVTCDDSGTSSVRRFWNGSQIQKWLKSKLKIVVIWGQRKMKTKQRYCGFLLARNVVTSPPLRMEDKLNGTEAKPTGKCRWRTLQEMWGSIIQQDRDPLTSSSL